MKRRSLTLPGLLLAAAMTLFTTICAAEQNASLTQLQQLAEQDDAEAQLALGLLYREGREVPRDYHLAQTWFRRAADLGNSDAQNNLGLMYDHGRGIERDFVLARLWYLKAAEQGHSNAQYNLALLYANGQGVVQDEIEAYAWANIAAAQSQISPAIELRDRLKTSLGPQCLTAALQKSRTYFARYVVPFQETLPAE